MCDSVCVFVLPYALKFRLSCLEYFSMNSTVVWVREMFPRVPASHGIITLAAAVIAGFWRTEALNESNTAGEDLFAFG